MYKIIGADQKEYGPVTSDQIRQWIAENRVNAQTRVKAEGTQDWQPLSSIAEFAAALGVSPSAPPPVAAPSTPPLTEELLAQDYRLDIGSCLTRSWELLKKNFWPMVGISFLVTVVIGGINQLLGLFTRPAVNGMVEAHHASPKALFIVFIVSVLGTPVYAVLMGGLFKYFLKLIRGEPAGVADAFSGFGPSFGQLLLVGLVQSFLTYLGVLFCIIPGVYLGVAWYFAVPLVIDRQMEFWAAMELSRKVVSKHWFVVFGCVLVMGLVACAGALACCVGIFVSMPLAFAALMYAYEDIFGRHAA